jgi:hypothetical protein
MILKLFSGNYLFKLVSLFTLIILLASCGAGRTGLSRKSSTTALQKDVLDFSKNILASLTDIQARGQTLLTAQALLRMYSESSVSD